MKEEVRLRILALSELNGGRLTAEQLFDSVAADPSHPARDEFCWDETEGWRRYNLSIARRLIRGVRVEVEVTELVARRVPVFAPEPGENGGYATLDLLRQDEDQSRKVAVSEFKEAARVLRRAQQIAIELGFSAATIEATIRELTGLIVKCEPKGARPARQLRR